MLIMMAHLSLNVSSFYDKKPRNLNLLVISVIERPKKKKKEKTKKEGEEGRRKVTSP